MILLPKDYYLIPGNGARNLLTLDACIDENIDLFFL